jgi:hypothetical protein
MTFTRTFRKQERRLTHDEIEQLPNLCAECGHAVPRPCPCACCAGGVVVVAAAVAVAAGGGARADSDAVDAPHRRAVAEGEDARKSTCCFAVSGKVARLANGAMAAECRCVWGECA